MRQLITTTLPCLPTTQRDACRAGDPIQLSSPHLNDTEITLRRPLIFLAISGAFALEDIAGWIYRHTATIA